MTSMGKALIATLVVGTVIAISMALRPAPAAEVSRVTLTPAQMAEIKPQPLKEAKPAIQPVKIEPVDPGDDGDEDGSGS